MGKIKWWLIHKLGGVTSAECRIAVSEAASYERILARGFQPLYGVQKSMNIGAQHTIMSNSLIALGDEQSDKRGFDEVKKELVRKIMESGYISYEKKDTDFGRVYKGNLIIGKGNGK